MIEVELNLQITLGSMDILTILILPNHEYVIAFSFFVLSCCCCCCFPVNILLSSGTESTACLQTNLLPQTEYPSGLERCINSETPHRSLPSQLPSALPFQSLQDLCRSRDQAWPSVGAHERWCHTCAELPRWAPTTSAPLRALPCCCTGWPRPGSAEESRSYTVVGRQANMEVSVRGWWTALGSVTTRSLGSW